MVESMIWICRILIGLVVIDNLQAACLFLFFPDGIALSFDLAGPSGRTAIQSIGILFLMWCVPYIFALVHPIRYRVSHIEACIMQTIGLVGEVFLLLYLPGSMVFTPASLQRFIFFDAGGLILLLLSLWLGFRISPRKHSKQVNS
jgi:hypothetical protein